MIRAELKAKAKSQIKGNIGILFLIYLVYSLFFAPFLAMMAGALVGVFADLFAMIAYPELMAVAAPMGLADFGIWYWIGTAGLFVVGFATPAFILSWTKIFIGLTNDQKPKVADLFSGFKSFGKALWLYILWMVFIFLWTLPFFVVFGVLIAITAVAGSVALVVILTILASLAYIAGIVIMLIRIYAYWQSFYIMAENPHMTARECLRESVRIMRGNKGKLFVLDLSFLGWVFLGLAPVIIGSVLLAFAPLGIVWYLIGLVASGIAFIWIMPYYYTTLAHFYHAVKAKPATQPSFAAATPAPVAIEVEEEIELDVEE